MASVTSEPSVIGASTQLVGRVSGSGGLRLEGSLRGDVAISGPLEVTAAASLEGNVEAGELAVAGTLNGDARTSGPIRVQAGASVRGELSGSQVTIEPGASVAVRLGTEFELDW
ncbi:MAG: polymer-forming cytoskeletal protein [Polyangiaceae bacterium]|nr:polymer-forming cytoskeletal protein [Polyangiaceae bacterium]